jgi:TPP-dependent pyruvate/acetoin dehydrogenase alpha subunit
VIFVCENNLWANQTPAALSCPTADIAPRAAGYGLLGFVVDGQDVLEVYDVASEAIARARAGDGPTLIEAKTYRFQGHCGISAQHEDPEECARRRQRDPIDLLAQKLLAEGALTPDALRAMEAEVMAEVDAAEAFARESPLPQPAMLGL